MSDFPDPLDLLEQDYERERATRDRYEAALRLIAERGRFAVDTSDTATVERLVSVAREALAAAQEGDRNV